MLRNVRNRVPGFCQVFSSLAANSAHRNALNLAPLGEVGKVRLSEVARARRGLRSDSGGRQQCLSEGFHVVFADAPSGAGALYFVDIDADFAREASHVRGGGNGLA